MTTKITIVTAGFHWCVYNGMMLVDAGVETTESEAKRRATDAVEDEELCARIAAGGDDY